MKIIRTANFVRVQQVSPENYPTEETNRNRYVSQNAIDNNEANQNARFDPAGQAKQTFAVFQDKIRQFSSAVRLLANDISRYLKSQNQQSQQNPSFQQRQRAGSPSPEMLPTFIPALINSSMDRFDEIFQDPNSMIDNIQKYNIKPDKSGFIDFSGFPWTKLGSMVGFNDIANQINQSAKDNGAMPYMASLPDWQSTLANPTYFLLDILRRSYRGKGNPERLKDYNLLFTVTAEGQLVVKPRIQSPQYNKQLQQLYNEESQAQIKRTYAITELAFTKFYDYLHYLGGTGKYTPAVIHAFLSIIRTRKLTGQIGNQYQSASQVYNKMQQGDYSGYTEKPAFKGSHSMKIIKTAGYNKIAQEIGPMSPSHQPTPQPNMAQQGQPQADKFVIVEKVPPGQEPRYFVYHIDGDEFWTARQGQSKGPLVLTKEQAEMALGKEPQAYLYQIVPYTGKWTDAPEPPDPPGWEGGFADNH